MNLTKTRNKNIELLRIFSIFLIIFLHMYRHASGGEVFDSGFSLNHIFLIIIGSWGVVGVFLFIIISAYFLIDSQEVKLNKLLYIAFCTTLYSLLTLFIASVYLGQEISIKETIKAILSPVLGNYWYITGYIVLYTLHPILNIVIKKLTTIELSCVVVAGFALCFMYKYIYVSAPIENLDLFFSIYFGIGLFKRVQKKIDYRKVYIFGYCAAVIVIFFGIEYLMHESDYISSILWDYIFKIKELYSKPYFAISFLGIAVIIFSICVMVDVVIRPIYFFLANKISENIGFIKK